MKPISNNVIIELDPSTEGKVQLSSGKTLQLDTSWDEYAHSVQEGVIVAIPDGLSPVILSGFGTPRLTEGMLMPEVGDRVFFHHMIHREKKIPASYSPNLKPSEGKEFYVCEYMNLFFRKNDDNIECFNHFVALERTEKSEDELTSSFGLEIVGFNKKKERQGRIKSVSPLATEYGLSVGDYVLFQEDSDYWVKIDGEEFYRMEFKDVEATIKNGATLLTES